MTEIIRITFSLPAAERNWLRDQAKANCTSINAELIRALRDNRERAEAAKKRRERKAEAAA